MKYVSLKNSPVKSFRIPVLDKGVNFGENPDGFSKANSNLCKNMWCRDGILQSRPAITVDINNIIGKEILKEAASYESSITDTEIFIFEKRQRIAVSKVFYSASMFSVYIFLIDEERNVTSIGNLSFSRIDQNTFYIPENITFFMGKSQTGGGIFALATLVNCEDFESRIYHIYEVNKDYSEWSRVTDYYVPTVYINGRGDSYSLAKQIGIATEVSPRELETLNMLDGRFYAYYSSDSYSSSFRLPFSMLSNESIKCRVYVTDQSYAEWMIAVDEDSATLDFYGTDVTIKVNREKGILSFHSEGGEYALPQMMSYKENNIRVFAKKEISNSFKHVVSCTEFVTINSKNVFSGGINKSEVYYSSFDNPLYFPMVSNNIIGSPSTKVTALVQHKNKLLAFKEKEIYSVEINSSKPINLTNLLIDNPATFYEADSFNIKVISDNVGCKNKSTIAKTGEFLIWQTAAFDILALSDNDICYLSGNIKPYLNELKNDIENIPWAVSFEDYYMLCVGNKAVILKLKSKNDLAWFMWEFPQNLNVCGAFSFNNKPILLCEDSAKSIGFVATLGGDKDTVLKVVSGGAVAEKLDFKSQIEFKKYRLCEMGKRIKINKIFLNIKATGDTKVKVLNGDEAINFRLSETDVCRKSPKKIKLVTNLKSGGEISLHIESRKAFRLGETEIYYKESGN